MEIPQIKDKVTARAFALQMAYGAFCSDKGILGTAKEYADFIIGDAKLPEIAEDLNIKVLDMWNELRKPSEDSHNTPFITRWYKNEIGDIQNETH